MSASRVTTLPSPLGPLWLLADESHLKAITWEPDHAAAWGAAEGDNAVLREARRQLEAYFAGDLRDFTLPLAPEGTEFQRQVWRVLTEIPFGETISYGEQARRLGRATGAARAVGSANGRNPLPIVIPCHRVIGASKTLVGYAGGLERKKTLLNIEGVRLEG